jgi:hypothetical protein
MVLFIAIAMLVGEASLNVALPGSPKFKEFWELLAAIGNTLSGIGTLFLSLAVGASFVTFFAQFWQLGIQQRQADESSKQLLRTAEIQAENLKVLQRQAEAALLTAKIQGLTSRIEAYEDQINIETAMIRDSRVMVAESAGLVPRMRGEQDKLLWQLNRILDDLKVGTGDDVPPAGTYSDPFVPSKPS